MADPQPRGRQMNNIEFIEDEAKRQATFSKRRKGLYKKASELSTFCGANVGVIIISSANKVHSFWHHSAETVIENHINQYVAPREESATILYYNRRLDDLLDEKRQLQNREREVENAMRTQPGRDWEGLDMDGLDEDYVTQWKTYFTYLNSNVNERLDHPTIELSNTHVSVGPSNFAPGPSTSGDYYNVHPQTASFGGGSSHIHQQGQGRQSTSEFGESSNRRGDARSNE